MSSGDPGINKKQFDYFKIHLLDSDGGPMETWSLINPWIKSMNLGELSYESDDLVQIQLVVAYDAANVLFS